MVELFSGLRSRTFARLITRLRREGADRPLRGPALGVVFRRPGARFPRASVLIVDGTLVPTRDHKVAAQSKNCRFSTNHQVVIDADTELVVALGRPLPGNRNGCRAWTESGAADACRNAVVIADGGYPGTGLIIPHRRSPGVELPEWKQAHNKSHRRVRARVELAFARMKTWKNLARLPVAW